MSDRENNRIQIFDANGKFLKQWTHLGATQNIFITPKDEVWVITHRNNIENITYDTLAGRIMRMDLETGKILGAMESPGHWLHVAPTKRDLHRQPDWQRLPLVPGMARSAVGDPGLGLIARKWIGIWRRVRSFRLRFGVRQWYLGPYSGSFFDWFHECNLTFAAIAATLAFLAQVIPAGILGAAGANPGRFFFADAAVKGHTLLSRLTGRILPSGWLAE